MSSASKIIKLAKREVGYHEGRSDGHWNNHEKYAPEVPGLTWAQEQPWCAVFVAWLALKSGLDGLYPRTASCDEAAVWYHRKGRLSQYPAVGAQFFLGTSADYTHTGLVTGYDDTYIYTIEGNTNNSGGREGDGVYEKRRTRASIGAYGYPKFPDGIKSADPKFASENPKKVSAVSNKSKAAAALAAAALAAAAAIGAHGVVADHPKHSVVKPVVIHKEKPVVTPKAKPVALHAGVKPGQRDPQVLLLKRLLKPYGETSPTDLYGEATKDAVRKFHKSHPQFGTAQDPAIGPKGFLYLQKRA